MFKSVFLFQLLTVLLVCVGVAAGQESYPGYPWSELGGLSLFQSQFLPSVSHNHGCGPNPLLQLVRDMPHWLRQSLREAS